MKRPVLELVNVAEYFSDNFALQDITLDLYPGEVHVIIGENGSGKSAIMKLVSGIFARNSGDIFLEGEPVNFSSVYESKARGIIHQLQDPQLFDNLTIAENIFFDRIPRKKSAFRSLDYSRMIWECRALFDELGITLDPETNVRRLNFAERQLVEAAHACVTESKVVIFDEPSSSMSEPERQILFAIVKKLKDRGAGIFYISHRFDEIMRVGDRVTVVHQGRIVDTREIASLDHDTLFRIMTGSVHRERYPRIVVSPGREVLSVSHLESDPVLRDICFSLKKGEILGITGLMGSGRTVLANCLFGVRQPSGGSIRIDGREVRLTSPYDALNNGIAMVPEDRLENGVFLKHDLVRNMTIAALERFLYGISTDLRVMHQLVNEYVERLHIRPGYASDILNRYSGGNQQKVMIARWLMKRARIYILDEPTRGVDIASRIDIYNAMNDLVTSGASILFISSEIEEILGVCDRVLVLSSGRIVCDLPKNLATKEEILAYATDDG